MIRISQKKHRMFSASTSRDPPSFFLPTPSVLACRLERGCPTRELPWAPPAHRTEGARRCGPACPPRWWSPAVRGLPPPSRSSSSSSNNSSSSSSRPSRTGPGSESDRPPAYTLHGHSSLYVCFCVWWLRSCGRQWLWLHLELCSFFSINLENQTWVWWRITCGQRVRAGHRTTCRRH